MKTRHEVGYFFPAPFWCVSESGWIKTLLLFFDQVAILLPRYMYGRHHVADYTLSAPLEERGLLNVLEPEEWVDEEVAAMLAAAIVDLLADGAFDELPRQVRFQELSMSRIGYGADIEIADSLVGELKAKNLARPTEDGASIPLHPTVRTTILVLLSQYLRVTASKRGITLHPATTMPEAMDDLLETLSIPSMPSSGKVIKLELEPATVKMDQVSLDDVLQFRDEHQSAHRAYMLDLRRFMAELAAVESVDERDALLAMRQEELADAAMCLQRTTRLALGKNLASCSLGLGGSAWSLVSGDPVGAVLSAAGVMLNLIGTKQTVNAYSYLFSAQERFGITA